MHSFICNLGFEFTQAEPNKDRWRCLGGKHAAFSSGASRQGTLSLFKATRLHISAARACWAVSHPEAHTLIVKWGGERQASYQALFSASGLCPPLDRRHLMPSEAKNKTRPCSSGSITKQGHNRHEIRLFQDKAGFSGGHLWKQPVALKVSNDVVRQQKYMFFSAQAH